MTLQPWVAIGDRVIEWPIPREDSEIIRFEHVNTRVLRLDSTGCAKGIAYWTSELKGCAVFIAFDWLEVRSGVPILTDPNAVLTNLMFVDDDGQHASELVNVAQLTLLLHSMNWQEFALDATRSYREEASQDQPHARQGYVSVEREPLELRKAA